MTGKLECRNDNNLESFFMLCKFEIGDDVISGRRRELTFEFLCIVYDRTLVFNLSSDFLL